MKYTKAKPRKKWYFKTYKFSLDNSNEKLQLFNFIELLIKVQAPNTPQNYEACVKFRTLWNPQCGCDTFTTYISYTSHGD